MNPRFLSCSAVAAALLATLAVPSTALGQATAAVTRLSIELRTNQAAAVRFQGLVRSLFQLETTTNSLPANSWTNLAPVTTDNAGLATQLVSQISDAPQRFFRARLMNSSPIALGPTNLTLSEDTDIRFQLQAYDPDGNTNLNFYVAVVPDLGSLYQVRDDDTTPGPLISSFCPLRSQNTDRNELVTNPRHWLIYRPCTNASGLLQDSYRYSLMQWKVSDGTNETFPMITPIFVLPVNDPPVAGNSTQTLRQAHVNETLAPVPMTISVSDIDNNVSVLTCTITGFPARGQLYRAATATPSNLITLASATASADSIYFVPDSPNDYGTNYASFTFTVSDGDLSGGPATHTLHILPDPRPADVSLNPTNFVTLEDTPLSFTLNGLIVNTNGADVDTNQLVLTLDELPAHGVLRLDNLPVGGVGYTWNFFATSGVVVTYLPDTNYNTYGLPPDSFRYHVQNFYRGPGDFIYAPNYYLDSPIVTFRMLAINDRPVLLMPANVTNLSGFWNTVTNIQVLDDARPADLLSCSISRAGEVTDILMVDPAGLQNYQTNATGTNITFDATLAAMNTAFSRGLSFRAAANNDDNNVTVLVVDNGSFGETNVVSQSRSFPLHVVVIPGSPP